MMTDKKPDPMADALLKKRKGLKLSIKIGPDEEEMEEEAIGTEPELAEDEKLTDEEMIDRDIDSLSEKSDLGRKAKEKMKLEKEKV